MRTGMCGAWWYDASSNTAYSIDHLNHMNRDYASMMNTFFGNWTTPDLLLGGAGRCHDNITTGGTLSLSNITSSSGSIESTCLSNVTVCTYDQTCMDSSCEFTDCPVQSGYFVNGCTGNGDGTFFTVNVPYGYLGPWLWGADADTIVCR